MATNKTNNFPPQKLPLSKKNKAWRETTLDSIISRYSTSGNRKANMKIAYDMMNGEFDLNDLKYVTDPYKVAEGFPAKVQNINIIRPKIELLKGEETKRPDAFIVYRTDEAAVDSVIDKQKDMIYQAMEDALVNGVDISSDEVMNELQTRMNQIKEYISREYYDPAEQLALKTLKYLKEKLNLKDEFLTGWGDGLTANEEIYYVGIVNGEPYLERVHPREMEYDQDPNLKNIDEGDWAVRHMRMTASAIYDRFYDKMDEGQLDALLEYINEGVAASAGDLAPNVNTSYIVFKSFDEVGDTIDRLIDVYHGVWKSFKKIGYLRYFDEFGEEVMDIVDETYKPVEGEEIVWDWINEWWEGYKIGEDLYLDIGPIQYQDHSIDNPNSQAGPYTGGKICGYGGSTDKSLVEVMKPLQYMYLVLWYRLELMLARDKGKVLLMDITQIPKSAGFDENKWMHYLTAMGVAFINPYDEGWNIPGREGGKPAAFNQFTDIDLSMSKVIGEYLQLLEKVEAMVGELSGVSKARQGQIHHRELVGNVEREVIQSSHITEPLFWKHNQIKKRALTNLLNVAKFAWRTHGKKKLNFILEGPERVFMEITDDFLYSDHDVFLTDSTKEYQNVQTLKTLYQPAMQNGATLLDIATIMTEDNVSEIKNKLAEIEKRKEEMTRQQQELEMQIEDARLQQEQEKNRIAEEGDIRRAETDIRVAEIQAESRQDEELGENGDLEEERLDLQERESERDYELNLRKQREVERHNKAMETKTTRKSVSK